VLDWLDFFLLFLLGSVGAFLSGFLGVGGGIVYVPILDFFLHKLGYRNEELVKAILANSLFTIIFSGVISLYNQYKLKNFYPKQILYTGIPAAVSVLGVTWLINQGEWYSKPMFNYFFSAMLLIVLVRMFMTRNARFQDRLIIKPIFYGIAGFFTGIISAFSGLGGGVVLTPVISDLFKQSIKKATSISNGVIPILACAVGLYNLNQLPPSMVSKWQTGYIVFPLVLPMILAAPVFAKLGVKMAHRVQGSIVKIIFASFTLLVLIKNIYEIIKTYV
jgi:uncharacterized membrane protein YfcA